IDQRWVPSGSRAGWAGASCAASISSMASSIAILPVSIAATKHSRGGGGSAIQRNIGENLGARTRKAPESPPAPSLSQLLSGRLLGPARALALVRIEEALAQPDRLGRDFDHLVVVDIGDRLLE